MKTRQTLQEANIYPEHEQKNANPLTYSAEGGYFIYCKNILENPHIFNYIAAYLSKFYIDIFDTLTLGHIDIFDVLTPRYHPRALPPAMLSPYLSSET